MIAHSILRWEVTPTEDGVQVTHDPAPGDLMRIPVATVHSRHIGTPRQFSNAALIAAAPALVEACMEAEAALELYADSGCCDGDQAHEDKCKVGQALMSIMAARKKAKR